RDNLLFKMTDDDWDLVIDTHLKGAFLCARAAQKAMVEQKYGKMVLLSSTSALGNRGQTNYSTAKAGLQGMARTLAIELGPFNVLVRRLLGQVRQRIGRRTAVRRRGLWRPGPQVRIEFGHDGQPVAISLPISSHSGLTGRSTVC